VTLIDIISTDNHEKAKLIVHLVMKHT